MTRGHFFGTTKKGYVIRLFGIIGVLLVLAGIVFNPSKQATYAASHKAINSPGDWTTYMGDNARSGFNSAETILNPATASQLKKHWMYHAGGSINTQPVVVNGVIYWGAWDGYERASDLNGNLLWQKYLGITTSAGCSPPTAGVASTATIATVSISGTPTQVVFVGGGDAQFYALDASDGHIIWSTPLGTSPSHMIWDAPAVYNGSVYIGVSSFGDCPLVKGQLIQMDVVTGTIQHTFTTVSKCSGGGIWGSPTIDKANNTIYAATGNATCIMGFSLIELSTTDLSLISFWRVPLSQRTGDSDFGSTPTLFQATINGVVHQMVSVVNKSGIYYAFDRSNISAGPVWQKQLSTGKGNHSPSAWDGTTLYAGGGATIINGTTCQGSVRALDPATGSYQWEVCLTAEVGAAVMLVPGLVIVGAGRKLIVLDATSGKQLFFFLDAASLSHFWGAASVSNGVLYIGNRDGNLYAFGL